MRNKGIMCRFCLKLPDSDPKVVDDVTRQIFEALQIQVNFHLDEDAVICDNCSETVSRLFSFKSVYVITEQMVLEFALRENKAIVNLKDVFHADNFDTNFSEDVDICRLCMKWNNTTDLTLISTLMNDDVSVEMWKTYMTEVDLTITKYPKVCFYCKDNIQCYSTFVWNVRAVEDKINGCGAVLGTRNEMLTLARNEDGEIQIYSCSLCTFTTKYKETLRHHMYSHKSKTDVEIHKEESDGKSYETLRKEHLNQHLIILHNRRELKWYECPNCSYKTHIKRYLNQHARTHLDRSQLKMYKCLECNYETHRKEHMERHIKIHPNRNESIMYECPKCSYKTHVKRYLNAHAKTHRDRNPLKMYKCFKCDYGTYIKESLERHMKLHQERSQLEIYKCLECKYETYRKEHLKRHLKIHQDRSKLKMYKCLECNYETYRKEHLTRHIKTHGPKPT